MSDEPQAQEQVTPPLVDLPQSDSTDTPSPPSTDAGGISDSRPEWLPENFKTGEDLAASYKELQSEYNKRVNVPEEYKVEVPQGLEIPDEYYTKFKDAGLTNDQTQAMLNFYAETVAPQFVEVSRELELNKLAQSLQTNVEGATEEAKKILEWAGKESNGEDLVKLHGSTASGVMYLKSYMEKQMNSGRMEDFSGSTPPSYSDVPTAEEFDRMVQNPEYATNPAYRAMVQEKMIKAEMRLQGLDS